MKKLENVESKMVLLGLGFFPFFLSAGLSASLLMHLQIISYHWGELLPICYEPTNWYSHKMLFGCAVAVIALFLLTAVRNWINHPMPAGKSLAALIVSYFPYESFFFSSIHSLIADCMSRLRVFISFFDWYRNSNCLLEKTLPALVNWWSLV